MRRYPSPQPPPKSPGPQKEAYSGFPEKEPVSAFSFATGRMATTPSTPALSKISRVISLSRICSFGTSVYAAMPTPPWAVISPASASSAA